MGLSGSDARLVPGQHVSVRVRREEHGGKGGGCLAETTSAELI